MIDRTLDSDEELLGPDLYRPLLEGRVVGDRQLWVVVSRDEELDLDLLGDRPDGGQGPLRVCREVTADGVLRIGDADPHRDSVLSGLLQRDRCGHA